MPTAVSTLANFCSPVFNFSMVETCNSCWEASIRSKAKLQLNSVSRGGGKPVHAKTGVRAQQTFSQFKEVKKWLVSFRSHKFLCHPVSCSILTRLTSKPFFGVPDTRMKNTFDQFFITEFCLLQIQTASENPLTLRKETRRELYRSWNTAKLKQLWCRIPSRRLSDRSMTHFSSVKETLPISLLGKKKLNTESVVIESTTCVHFAFTKCVFFGRKVCHSLTAKLKAVENWVWQLVHVH